LVVAGLVGGIELRAQGQTAPAAQAPAPVAPPDTAALRAQYERWRTEFKTWGKWAPLGQESKGASSLITPEKIASAMKLAKERSLPFVSPYDDVDVVLELSQGTKFEGNERILRCSGKNRFGPANIAGHFELTAKGFISVDGDGWNEEL
jgi:hypothetical protein